MSEYIWKTEMRPSPAVARTEEEYRVLKAAREADRLRGQAALRHVDGDRWQVIVLPDWGTFSSEVVVSAADARTLAVAILREQLSEAWTESIDALAVA